jgi:exopolyphosphatase / guanosine-5'-triphosphate,3'-diphosphate pyrophosphatase
VRSVTGRSRVAAIDCGTNSLRLLIADVDPAAGRLTEIDRRMEIVRLGQGVDATGRLAPEALGRTLAVLGGYAAAIREQHATAVRMVATSATRDAANAADFVRAVTDVLGTPPEVLSGAAEAHLSYTGATAELPTGGSPYLVVDIGGGSTEFVLGGRPGAADGDSPGDGGPGGDGPGGDGPGGDGPGGLCARSVDIGCVRLTERHLHDDPPTAAQIEAAGADIGAALDEVAAVVPAARARTLVGLAGSVTTLAALVLGLPGYDPARIHLSRMTAAEVDGQTRRLLGMTSEQRARLPVMHPGRADVIGGGALVLDHVMRRFSLDEVLVSEHDILDGIAWSLAGGGGW